MAIILSILKIIGTVLLIVLLILAILAACVLLIPARYFGQGDIENKKYFVRISWFFRLLQFRFQYENENPEYDIYILGIRSGILDPRRIKKRKEKKEKRQAEKRLKLRQRYLKKHRKDKKNIVLYEEVPAKETPQKGISEKNISEKEVLNKEASNKEILNEKTSDLLEQADTKEEQHRESKTSDAGQKEESEKDNSSFYELLSKCRKVFQILKKIKDGHLAELLMPHFKTLMYHVRPRDIRGDLSFGLSDPSLTGKAVGALSCIFFLYQYEDLNINPDFETEDTYFKGTFQIMGHIRGIHIVLFIFRIFRQKEFRTFLKSLKQK